MQHLTGRLYLFIIVFGTVFFAANSQVFAASTPISLTTSPVTLAINIMPGTSDTRTLELMNNGTQPLKINMVLDEFGANSTTGQPQITTPTSTDESAKWVKFSPSSFIAEPGVWSKVQMTINLPKSANLGYYYTVVFQPSIVTTSGNKTTSIKGSNGILVLVDTGSSNEQRQLNIAKFSISKSLYEYLPTTFTVSVHNSGNIFLAPVGDIYISRSSNISNSIASLSVNSAGGNVLPHSTRDFKVNWTNGFPSYQAKTVDGQVVSNSKGQPVMQLKWNFTKLNQFRFGKYYAKLTLVYNDGQKIVPLTGVVSFWVIPWKLLLLLLVIIIIIGFGVWSIIRGIVRRIRGLKGIKGAKSDDKKPKTP